MKKIQCGGFYVDDGAIETREGKPFLKTGGSDPIVENAKATGGFGYTEQGEQTVITWDGDTGGRDTISISVRGMTINYCKVAEKGTGYTDTAKYTEPEGDHVANLLNGDGAISYVTDFPVVIIADGGEFNFDGLFGGTAPSSGVYFVYLDGNDTASSLTYGTPDTVHKIDEKYLPMDAIREALGL